jgi:hypothetical protein
MLDRRHSVGVRKVMKESASFWTDVRCVHIVKYKSFSCLARTMDEEGRLFDCSLMAKSNLLSEVKNIHSYVLNPGNPH